jgi:hypothetical protein
MLAACAAAVGFAYTAERIPSAPAVRMSFACAAGGRERPRPRPMGLRPLELQFDAYTGRVSGADASGRPMEIAAEKKKVQDDTRRASPCACAASAWRGCLVEYHRDLAQLEPIGTLRDHRHLRSRTAPAPGGSNAHDTMIALRRQTSLVAFEAFVCQYAMIL